MGAHAQGYVVDVQRPGKPSSRGEYIPFLGEIFSPGDEPVPLMSEMQYQEKRAQVVSRRITPFIRHPLNAGHWCCYFRAIVTYVLQFLSLPAVHPRLLENLGYSNGSQLESR